MIQGEVIIEALRARLEVNEELQAVLGTIPNTSKIAIRNTPPPLLQAPLVLISDLTVEVLRQGQGDRNYAVTVDLLIIVADLATEDKPNYAKIYAIADLIDYSIRGRLLGQVFPFHGETDTISYFKFDLVGSPGATPIEGGNTMKQVTYRGTAQEKINVA